MQEQNTILIIDGRSFMTEIAGEMLERFLLYILNRANAKIVLITASGESRGNPKTRRSSSSAEVTIQLGPLDYKSTARLFWNKCPLLSSNEKDYNCTIDTVDEFESYLVPHSIVSKQIAMLDPNKPNRSHRQKKLYDLMGKGNPRDIAQKAILCTRLDLFELLRTTRRPEVSVASSKQLEEEHAKWVARKEHAVQNNYYLRASDIEKTLQELEQLRESYPGLEDMKRKGAELKEKFTTLLKAKRYDDANFIKRKLLSLKRSMMKERSCSSVTSEASTALESILEIQQRMKTMMALAESLGQIPPANQSTSTSTSLVEAVFSVSDICTLKISPGSLWTDFPPATNGSTTDTNNSLAAVVVWTNEACDISGMCKQVLAFADAESRFNLSEKISAVDNLAETQWGTAKCTTGESIALDAAEGDLCIVLAVPPLVAKDIAKDCNNGDLQHMVFMQLRSAIRSSFRTIQRSNGSNNSKPTAIGISTNTSPHARLVDGENDNVTDNGKNVDVGSLSVTLKTIVDEIRRDSDKCIRTVHLLASSGAAESTKLIQIALEMGLATTAYGR